MVKILQSLISVTDRTIFTILLGFSMKPRATYIYDYLIVLYPCIKTTSTRGIVIHHSLRYTNEIPKNSENKINT